MTGIEVIAAERQRQIEQEGWTTDHDDQHESSELARAAACYALPKWARMHHLTDPTIPRGWPWQKAWWKPTPDDRVRELTKAGALIAAEIDRLLRLES